MLVANFCFVFTATASTTVSRGLGGVDPASLASSKANNGSGNNTATTR